MQHSKYMSMNLIILEKSHLSSLEHLKIDKGKTQACILPFLYKLFQVTDNKETILKKNSK